MLEKEAGLYVPTGTMSNLIAIGSTLDPVLLMTCALRTHSAVPLQLYTADAGTR